MTMSLVIRAPNVLPLLHINPYCKIKIKRQRINTVTFYLHDISTRLVRVVFKHIDHIQEPLC